MADNVIDFTEPTPFEALEAVENVYEDPWLWRVELYAVSKYMPEMAESSIFKMRVSALPKHRVVYEDHKILDGLQGLSTALSNDIARVPLVTANTPHKRTYAGTPGISANYEQQAREERLGI